VLDCISALNLTCAFLNGKVRSRMTVRKILGHMRCCEPCRVVITKLYVRSRLIQHVQKNEGGIWPENCNDGHYNALGLALVVNSGPCWSLLIEMIQVHLNKCESGCPELRSKLEHQAQVFETEFTANSYDCFMHLAGLE